MVILSNFLYLTITIVTSLAAGECAHNQSVFYDTANNAYAHSRKSIVKGKSIVKDHEQNQSMGSPKDRTPSRSEDRWSLKTQSGTLQPVYFETAKGRKVALLRVEQGSGLSRQRPASPWTNPSLFFLLTERRHNNYRSTSPDH